jgi:Flp pilus assembly CpaF family ATPase
MHRHCGERGRFDLDNGGGTTAPTGGSLTDHAARRIVNLVSDIDNHPIEKAALSANLPTGERFAALLPPTVRRIIFSIRLPPGRVFTLEDYVASGIMIGAQADTLRRAVSERRNILIVGGTGAGKAQPDDALVLTPTGFRRIGDLKVGDPVRCPDGAVARITGVFPQGEKNIHRVTFEDGRTVECCDDHLWKVWTRKSEYVRGSGRRGSRKRGMGWRVVPLSQIRRWFEIGRKMHERTAVPLAMPFALECPPQELPVPPYALGALIGDGDLGNGTVVLSSPDRPVIDRVLADLPSYEAVHVAEGTVNYRLRQKRMARVSPLKEALGGLGLLGKRSHEKFVPEVYKRGSVAQRLALLQGLLDTDGTTRSGSSCVSFSTTSGRLARDVRELAWSLGAIARISNRQTYFRDAFGNRKAGRPSFVVNIVHPDTPSLFSLPRQVSRIKRTTLSHRLRISSIEPVGARPARCISVDHPEGLYVTDGYVVTHNTTLANALLAEPDFQASRTCIIQDQDELKCSGPNVVRAFTGAMTARELVREFLRHNPDRIVIGEIRDGATALEWIGASNTGHPGGLSTAHANSAAHALSRISRLIGQVAVNVPHADIVEAVELVAFIRRERDGSRRLAEIVRPVGHDGERYRTETA